MARLTQVLLEIFRCALPAPRVENPGGTCELDRGPWDGKVRLEVELQPGFSGGILEWRLPK